MDKATHSSKLSKLIKNNNYLFCIPILKFKADVVILCTLT